jgi:membrane protease YdiL (CAAX protease family)
MNTDNYLTEFDMGIVVAFLSVGIGFSIYWFHASSSLTRSFFFSRFMGDWQWVLFVAWQRVSGFLLLGVVPLAAITTLTNYSLADIAWRAFNFTDSLAWTVPMTALIIPLTFSAARNKVSLRTYPQMRVAAWHPALIAINSTSWFLYLLGYELLFRGILLTVCADEFGFVTAVAINLTLYAITHIPKGANETLGSFIYGSVVCLATAATGNIAVAVITHVIMALANDYFSVLHSKEMRFVHSPIDNRTKLPQL